MIGSFLTRGLVMILGYAYPAYECFKTVERNKPEIEQLRFWCQYWILVAVMTVFERVGDTFVSWVPMYSEAKLAFIIYLWYPRTKGTTYVYDSFFKPYVAKHEPEIDRNLLELRTRAGDMAFMYCQKVVIYGHSRIFEILQFVAARSAPMARPTQAEQQAPRARQPPTTTPAATPPPRQPTTPPPPPQPTPQPQVEPPPSLSSTTSSSQEENDIEDEHSSTQSATSTATSNLPPPPSPARIPLKKAITMPSTLDSPRRSTTNKAESSFGKSEKPAPKSPPPAQDSVMEDAIRVTRGRLRKTRSAAVTK